jgi:PhnB protein
MSRNSRRSLHLSETGDFCILCRSLSVYRSTFERFETIVLEERINVIFHFERTKMARPFLACGLLLSFLLASYDDDQPGAKLPTPPSNTANTRGETMTDTTIIPYLFFGGRCAEALEFYRKSLGEEVDKVMRYDESPQPAPPRFLATGFKKKIMHASFRVRGVPLMAANGRDDKSKSDGVWLVLTLPTEAECRRAFDARADGGKVQMPLTKTFKSPCFGMLTDRLGIGWMVTVPQAPAS